ncbi:MAG: leucine-rich repeat protein [Clostridia bacterium]|nr:leucine-rich repeat protein [Clostridia bacterium]
MRRVFCLLAAALILWTAAASAVTLPSGLKEIGEEAYAGLPVTEIELPDGLQRIGPHAFSTRSLRWVKIPASVNYIAPTAFDGTAGDFCARVEKGSYAEQWCIDHGIAYDNGGIVYETPAVTALSFSQQGAKYIGTPYSVLDCQAFVEVCLRDAGINKNLAGSNAWYRQMDWTGTPEECVALFGTVPKGAFLFIHAYDHGEPLKYWADGLGNASHIGICTGTGLGAIHSSYSRYGVYESSFRNRTINGGWNRVGLWKELDYGEEINTWLRTH